MPTRPFREHREDERGFSIIGAFGNLLESVIVGTEHDPKKSNFAV